MMIGQFVLVVSSVQTIITKFNFLWLKKCAVSWSSQFYEDCNVVYCTRFGSKLIEPIFYSETEYSLKIHEVIEHFFRA